MNNPRQHTSEELKAEILGNLDAYFPDLNFRRQGNGWNSQLHLLSGEKGCGRNTQSSINAKGNATDWGTGDSLSVIDLFAVRYLGITGDEKERYSAVYKYIYHNEDAGITANIPYNANRGANKPLKPKEGTNVYLTKDKAEFRAFFGQRFIKRNEANGKSWAEVYETSLNAWTTCNNNLVNYLLRLFQGYENVVLQTLSDYGVMVRNSNYTNKEGVNTSDVFFVYADELGRIANLKPMKYKPDGHRYATGNYNFTANKWLKVGNEYQYTQEAKEGAESDKNVLFGQHLLDSGSMVFAVESEKSAIMLRIYLAITGVRGAVVLAIGGCSNFGKLLDKSFAVTYIPDYEKAISKADVLAKDLQRTVHGYDSINTAVTASETARKRRSNVSINADFGRSVLEYVHDDFFAKGADVGDVVEVLMLNRRAVLFAPEHPQTIEGAEKIASHSLVDLNVLKNLARRTWNGFCLVRYGFEMFQKVMEDGDILLVFDFHAMPDKFQRVEVAYSQEADPKLTRANITRMFYSVFGVNCV